MRSSCVVHKWPNPRTTVSAVCMNEHHVLLRDTQVTEAAHPTLWMCVIWAYTCIVDLDAFSSDATGSLVPIQGNDPTFGEWQHRAFVPNPLPDAMPTVSMDTFMRIAEARAALAALDSTGQQLERPELLRQPTLRREAQSTSALEGTYAPLSDVLTADEQDPGSPDMREILNYVRVANHGYASLSEGRPLSTGMLCDMQGMLVKGTRHEGPESGHIRESQVVVGQRHEVSRSIAPVYRARYIPAPPGQDLDARLGDLLAWMNRDHKGALDPVVVSGMAHYQFETLHPFHDGNGRLGRLLMTMQLVQSRTLAEPTLTVSPWFEARRAEYYDRLFGVSASGDWDSWLAFYATGLAESATATRTQMLEVVRVRNEMIDVVTRSPLRAATAFNLVDYAVSHPTFTIRQVERDLNVSYARANRLVEQLCDLELLQELNFGGSSRRFHSPDIFRVLTRA